MHFQEVTASLLLSERRGHCKQFEITPAADLEAIYDVEKDNNQMFFDIWCEARLPSGQYIQCWPQFRHSKGSRYDWVMMKFESKENNGEEAIVYPGKVLALCKDSEGTVKALVHSVEYKTATNVWGLTPCNTLLTGVQPKQQKTKNILSKS